MFYICFIAPNVFHFTLICLGWVMVIWEEKAIWRVLLILQACYLSHDHQVTIPWNLHMLCRFWGMLWPANCWKELIVRESHNHRFQRTVVICLIDICFNRSRISIDAMWLYTIYILELQLLIKKKISWSCSSLHIQLPLPSGGKLLLLPLVKKITEISLFYWGLKMVISLLITGLFYFYSR